MAESLFLSLENAEEDEEEKVEKDLENSSQKTIGWMTMLYVLAEGRVAEYERVLRVPAVTCFTHLAFEKSNKKLWESVKK